MREGDEGKGEGDGMLKERRKGKARRSEEESTRCSEGTKGDNTKTEENAGERRVKKKKEEVMRH